MVYLENNFIDSDDNKYLTVYSLIKINNTIIGPYKFFLRKVNLKPYGFDRIYIDKYLVENKLY